MSAMDLLRELRLRPISDTSARISQMIQQKLGLLKRRFPSHPADPNNLRAVLPPETDPAQFTAEYDQNPVFFPPISITDPSPELLKQAKDASQGRFSYFGSPVRQFHDEIDWFHALETEGSWPSAHWSEISYRQNRLGDIKTCWEWNRHQHFPMMAVAWRFTGEDVYAEAFTKQLLSWCKQNPPETGIHYLSNMELGLRCISWIWAHHLFRESSEYHVEARLQLHLNIYYMARHIHRRLEHTSKTGRTNHLIGDAASLAFIALAYPQWTCAAQWKQEALHILKDAWRTQFSLQGGHFEVCPEYHLFILEFVMPVLALHHLNEPVDYDNPLIPLLDQSVLFLTFMLTPDHQLPPINDADGGRALPLSISIPERVHTILALAAMHFSDPSFASLLPNFPLQARLFQDPQQHPLSQPFEQAIEGSPDSDQWGLAHQSHGVTFIRSHWGADAGFLVFDNHHDPFPDSGHGHAASLSLLLWHKGKPLFTDSGTYRYTVEPHIRNGLRSSAAHNTVLIDDQPLAKPNRDFGWLSALKPGETHFGVNTEGLEYFVIDGSHHNYPHITHRRVVLWWSQLHIWLIADCFTASGAHQYQQFWHLPTEVAITGQHPLYHLENPQLQLNMPGGSSRIVTPKGGQPIWAMESRAYGDLRPKQVILRTWEATGDHIQWTWLSEKPIDTSIENHKILIQTTHQQKSCIIQVHVDSQIHILTTLDGQYFNHTPF